MSRLPRSFLEDGVYHVTARGVDGCPIYRDDVDRLDFRWLLRGTSKRFDWESLAWCQMTTHYHLVLEATREDLSSGMHYLNGTYARRFNARHGRRGHLFEGRFSAWVVRDEEHLDATLRYVLDNPRRAGLCEDGSDWPWLWAAPSIADESAVAVSDRPRTVTGAGRAGTGPGRRLG